MPRGSQVSVEPRPEGRRTVQTDGTQRAESLHDRKSDSNADASSRPTSGPSSSSTINAARIATVTTTSY